MGKKEFQPMSPHFWSADEHARFLDALEKVGPCAPSGAVWGLMADHIGTRTYKDVQLHANRYFLQLQMINTQKRKELQAMQSIDSLWTREEDALFEELLGAASSGTYYNWTAIAARFQAKSAKAVRDRYMKLIYDVAAIENGHHVTIHFGGAPSLDDDGVVYDCCSTLTPEEEDVLMEALEESKVPAHATSNALAVVASAVVALTNHTSKQPPTRQQLKFSKDDAKCAIMKAVAMETTDTGAVLGCLHASLRLREDSAPTPSQHDFAGYARYQDHKTKEESVHRSIDMDVYAVL
ncbi:hypothetical protein ACHHYP_07405 [Achlya hypogyna]|uniref:Uncharacterized protein n=1 Tax=Achlya hypogyna TaxID=1202772 RepID=A0A1V9ZLY1_ACHHY|nr:hypothetical protein ACHHYP_07405 [Achlya hypogyna]